MTTRRVAITGLGIVSCFGHDLDDVSAALRAGRSGIQHVPEWEDVGFKSQVAGVPAPVDERLKALKLPKAATRPMSGSARACVLAALDAVDGSGLTDAELADRRTGCFVGAGSTDLPTIHEAIHKLHEGRPERTNPFTVLHVMNSSPSASVTNLLGIKGRSYSLSSACATASHNIGHAYELISGGVLDRAVAGAGEELELLIAGGFDAIRLALSTHYNHDPQRASRPYDTNRDGFVMGGGSAIVVLEEMSTAQARGAHIYGELAGFGATSDAYGAVLPDPTGAGGAACMADALADADLSPAEVDYINTHGTSTVEGDVAELKAIRTVFGEDVPAFSSTKSMTGHGLGSAGGQELIFSLLMMRDGFIAPSINVDEPDPEVKDLPLVTEPTDAHLDVIMSNSFGFGGTNASLVLRRV